jgi:hypothetical protein
MKRQLNTIPDLSLSFQLSIKPHIVFKFSKDWVLLIVFCADEVLNSVRKSTLFIYFAKNHKKTMYLCWRFGLVDGFLFRAKIDVFLNCYFNIFPTVQCQFWIYHEIFREFSKRHKKTPILALKRNPSGGPKRQ